MQKWKAAVLGRPWERTEIPIARAIYLSIKQRRHAYLFYISPNSMSSGRERLSVCPVEQAEDCSETSGRHVKNRSRPTAAELSLFLNTF